MALRIPSPVALTKPEAYLAYKAGILSRGELKDKLLNPINNYEGWLAKWCELLETYPTNKDGTPQCLTDEEGLLAYLCGVTNRYPATNSRPDDARISAYIRYLVSVRYARPDHPLNREEFYLSLIKPQFVPSGDPSSDIVLNGTTKAPFLDVKVYGDTFQTTYSGKNLFNFAEFAADKIAGGAGGVIRGTATASGDSITITATGDDAYTSYTSNVPPEITVTPNTDMVLSWTSNATLSNDGNVYVFGKSGDSTTTIGYAKARAGSYAFNTGSFSVIKFRLGVGTSGNSITYSDIQMEYGSTATQYEPYVGGTPAPNPSYPQNIQVVTGEQTVKITGKNLLDITQSSAISLGTYVSGANTNEYKIEATGNDIFVNKVGLNGSTWDSTKGNLIPCAYGETIYFSVGDSSFAKNFFTEYDENLVSLGYTNVSGSSGTYTPTSPDCKYVVFRFGNGFSVSGTTYTLSPIVCKTNDTSYEPYQSQSHEINLGKNLVNISDLADTNITVADGVATGTGTQFYTSYGQNTGGVPFIKKNGQLSISFKAYTDGNISTANTDGLAVLVRYTDGTTALAISCKNNETTAAQHTVTTTSSKDVASIQLTYVNVGGNIWHISEFQIEQGQPTSYAPYKTPLELAKVDTYQDYIWRDNGTWKIHKEVGKVVYDGAQSWSQSTPSTDYQAYFIATSDMMTASPLLCDNFTQIASNEATNAAKVGIASHASLSRIYIVIPRDLMPLGTWLSTHNTTVYYALATPTDTEITDQTLIDQLEALMQGGAEEGTTYIKVSATDPNLPAKLYVEAPKYD